MKQFYMDTNVYISALKPDDPYHSPSKTIITALERNELHAQTSVLTLLEVASASARAYATKKGHKDQKERRIFMLRTLQRLAALKVKFINITGDTRSSIRGIEAILPSVFNQAILLSLRSTLKTLDLIHLAAAKHAKQLNDELDAFVTGDKALLSNKKELSEIMKIPILSPAEYADALRI